jgi:SAM-dependent MidA family methyltransferase
MAGGRALLFDYGREAADYFAPHRASGTLRGYYRHRRCDDPFAAPGETDLTADVNFTALATEARQAGFLVHGPQRQGPFLTRLASARLAEPPVPDAAWRRQFQTLTHPNHLGHLFQAVVLEKPGAT